MSKNKLRFFRALALPTEAQIGDIYFIYDGVPTIYIYTGGEDPWEAYAGGTGEGGDINLSDYATRTWVIQQLTPIWQQLEWDTETLPEGVSLEDLLNEELTTLETENKTIVGAINELKVKSDEIKPVQSMVSIPYSELLSLKNTGSLIPGMQYRIIDYVTTVKASDSCASAQHPFDIIVTADSTTTLNENARAIQRDGDTYFANSNLSVWKLKYKLDNDTTYKWIDDSCKGVIYEMTDEFNNTFCYDFKNILQARYLLTNTENSITNNRYLGWAGHSKADNSNFKLCYTFADFDNLAADLSLNQTTINGNKVLVQNVKLPTLYQSGDERYLNDVVFLHTVTDMSNEEWCNVQFGDQCYNITISSHCYDIKIADTCSNIILDSNNRELEINSYCRDVIIGPQCYDYQIASNCHNFVINSSCYSFTIGNECNGFTIGTNCRRFNIANYCREFQCGSNCQIWSCGNNCSNWSCGSNCSFWTCGEQCYQWYVGNDCNSWSVGNGCNNWHTGNKCAKWSTGNECSSWSVGIECNSWSTGNGCYSWSTKDYCSDWSVGNGCHTWSVGNNCIAWKAGNRCYNWVFGGQNAPKDYFNSITIESYNHNFALNTVYTTSASKICRGIHIAEMAFASLTDWTNYGLTEGNGNVNQLFCTTIGKSGDKKLNVT